MVYAEFQGRSAARRVLRGNVCFVPADTVVVQMQLVVEHLCITVGQVQKGGSKEGEGATVVYRRYFPQRDRIY